MSNNKVSENAKYDRNLAFLEELSGNETRKVFKNHVIEVVKVF